jgi:hypothetical protein
VEVRDSLDVDRYSVRPSLDKGLHQSVRVRHHEVHIEWQFREAAHRRAHRRSEGEVGDEVTIHHVEVEKIRTGHLDGANLVGDVSQITCQ